MFNKNDERKVLNFPKNTKKDEFVEYLKTNVKTKKSKIITPICEGDGTGINKKISCWNFNLIR